MSKPIKQRGSISVVIPAYGHAAYIGQTLESLLQQTRPADQILVINDGSPDDTAGAVHPYLDKITYIEQENRGLVQTLNRGLALCSGDYVCTIGSDDWLAPHALEATGAILDRYPEVGLVHGGVTIVDTAGRPHPELAPQPYPKGLYRDVSTLFRHNYIVPPAALCRRAALNDAGPFLDHPYTQDWAMWLSIPLHGWALYGLDEKVAFYRRHGNKLSDAKNFPAAHADERRMLSAMAQRYLDKLAAQGKGPIDGDRRRLLRMLGWRSLARGDRRTARRAFGRVVIAALDVPSVPGLVFAFLPSRVYADMRQVYLRFPAVNKVGRRVVRH
jgi:glycosyltransferase involved in cell wall biosynthesis